MMLGVFKAAISTAYPTIQAPANSTQTADTTSHPITLPTGVTVGDLLVVMFGFDGVPTVSIGSGSGWTIEDQTALTAQGGAVIWKIADGTDALTLTTSASERSAALTYRISGAVDLELAVATGSADPPNLAPSGGSDDYLWLVFYTTQDNATATAAPANYTNFTTVNSTGSNNGSSVAVARRNLTASSEDPGAFTSPGTSGGRIAYTIAIFPP